MSEQLNMFRKNAVLYIEKCGECFDEHRRKMKVIFNNVYLGIT